MAAGYKPAESPRRMGPGTPQFRGQGRGRFISHYEIGKTLGSGSFATVKECRDVRTGERYAVKIVEKRTLDANLLNQFTREIAAMRILKHDHIVDLADILETSERYYLVMELLKGSLIDVVADLTAPMPESRVRILFQQIVAALEYCHSCGICHRDLKLENVLVGEGNTVKVTDFGMVNAHSAGEVLYTVCGSVDYTAPEVLREVGYDGFIADVWSAGVLLFVLATCTLPFRGKNRDETVRRIMRAGYVVPSYVSSSLNNLLNGMLEPDPAKRWSITKVKEHPWVAASYHDNIHAVQVKFTLEQLKSEDVERNVHQVKERPLNAFDVVSQLYAGAMDNIVAEGAASSTFCFFTSKDVNAAIQGMQALLEQFDARPSVYEAQNEVVCHASVASGVLACRACFSATPSAKTTLVTMVLIRGDTGEFQDFCKLVSHLFGNAPAASPSAPTPVQINGFDLAARLIQHDLRSLINDDYTMSPKPAQNHALLCVDGKSTTCAALVEQLVAVFDKLGAGVVHVPPSKLLVYRKARPLLTFSAVVGAIATTESKFIVELQLRQGLAKAFADFVEAVKREVYQHGQH